MKKTTATVIKIIVALLAVAAAVYCVWRYREKLLQAWQCLRDKLQGLCGCCRCPEYDDFDDV